MIVELELDARVALRFALKALPSELHAEIGRRKVELLNSIGAGAGEPERRYGDEGGLDLVVNGTTWRIHLRVGKSYAGEGGEIIQALRVIGIEQVV